MSDTPRTDRHSLNMETEDFDVELAKTYELARQLERDLAKWQALAGLLAAPLDFIVTKTDGGNICFHNLYDSTAEMAHKAIAAYESATSTIGKPETTQ